MPVVILPDALLPVDKAQIQHVPLVPDTMVGNGFYVKIEHMLRLKTSIVNEFLMRKFFREEDLHEGLQLTVMIQH